MTITESLMSISRRSAARRTQPARVALAGLAASSLLLIAGPANATQYSPPWADTLWGHWPEPGALDTQGTMNIARDGLKPSYNAVSSNPSSAHASLNTLFAQSDAIWWMAGHGNVGYITTYNSTNGSTVINVSNQVPGSSCASPSACLTDYTFSQMHDIRTMIFQGCWSGSALSNGDRLAKRAYNNLGVDSAIGFAAEIGFSANTSDTWADYFTSLGMGNHDTVYDSAWGATNMVFFRSGGYNGYDALNIYGNSTKIWPAQYGS